MEHRLAILLNEYIEKVKEIESYSELRTVEEQYRPLLPEGLNDDEAQLVRSVFELAAHLVVCKDELACASIARPRLSDEEMNENLLVQQLLDENLFTYHFQPIVRVDNGEIFAYEALMRAGTLKGITPFHILKYAELTGRLFEVEQYTFLNVLKLAKANSERLKGRPIFLNSMPDVHILPEKAEEIERLLEAESNVVVEMIESSEYNDSELDDIKQKFARLGIPIAIDDFGTGYSNISNLLRYTPNFVKIDRSLLSGIENSANKKHFVREIIDFCHENGIMALAEGVESFEELRTVILLGADLIQGFYTAKPSAELIEAIPFEIREEIRTCRLEREDGRRLKIYKAEKDERISLERLNKEGYSCIQIGTKCSGSSVTVMGNTHLESGIHIITADGFYGGLVFENARLSNRPDRPCLDIGSGNRLTLTLVGSNRLDDSGIRVPQSSVFRLEGKGNLDIRLGNADFYGIGNDLQSAHGRLEFMQDGTVSITAKSHGGVCIGSGLGGVISIGRGRYVLDVQGSSSMGVGAFAGSTEIELLGCDFECTVSGAYSVGIGTAGGSLKLHLIYSSIRIVADGQLAVGLGSLHEGDAHIHAESVNINIEMSADTLAVFGVLEGSSDIRIEKSSVKLSADGTHAIAFGGGSGSRLALVDADISGKISTSVQVLTYASAEDIRVSGGRLRLQLNDRLIDGI